MSHNVTLSAVISPTQLLAVEALAGGASVTEAARAAGVVRETVSRWMHHDPVFLAELHNTRADLAAQTRSALEALGMTAVATLREALQDLRMRPTRLRAACAILKMIGADRAETLAPTTPLDMHVRLREREEEIRQRQADLDAKEVDATSCSNVTSATEPEFVATAPATASPEPDGRIAGEPTNQAPEIPKSQPTGDAESDEPVADQPRGDSGTTAPEQVQAPMTSSARSTSQASSRIKPRLESTQAGQVTTEPSRTYRKAW